MPPPTVFGIRARALAGILGLAGGLAAATAGPERAEASVTHVVEFGETLSGIAAVNGFATSTLAAFNGIAEADLLYAGSTLEIPSAEEAASVSGTATTTSTASYGYGLIPSPWGDLSLDPAAAAAWNSMRAVSLEQYGIDLAPAGTLSAHRTYEQQSYLYELYLSGQGAPANPPGTSTHELGVAVDLADPSMRSVIDQIGPSYGWYATIPSEWWHVQYTG